MRSSWSAATSQLGPLKDYLILRRVILTSERRVSYEHPQTLTTALYTLAGPLSRRGTKGRGARVSYIGKTSTSHFQTSRGIFAHSVEEGCSSVRQRPQQYVKGTRLAGVTPDTAWLLLWVVPSVYVNPTEWTQTCPMASMCAGGRKKRPVASFEDTVDAEDPEKTVPLTRCNCEELVM